MRVIDGSYDGSTNPRVFNLGGEPGHVVCKADAFVSIGHHSPTMWCGRSNAIGGFESHNAGCRILDRGFGIGTNATWNTNAVKHHYLAFMRTDNCGFDSFSYMGNATAGNVIKTPQNKQVAAVILKRDSVLSSVIATRVSASALATSVATIAGVTNLGVGQFTVSGEAEVNELNGPAGIGEEVNALVFYEDPNVKVATWTGDGVTGRVLASANFDIVGAFIYRVTVGGGSLRFKTRTMSGGSAGPASSATLQANEVEIVGKNLVAGSSVALNGVGVVYGAILVGAGTQALQAPAIIRSAGRRAVELTGTSSYIDCGTADGALMVSGAMTLESTASFLPTLQAALDASGTRECPLIARGNGPYGTANGYSWGLNAFRSADGALAWPGHQLHVCTAERLDNGPDIRRHWRTGILLPYAPTVFHALAVHRGLGEWELWLNGRLVKQRRIDVQAALGLPNIQSQSGHRTVIGARNNSGTFASPFKMRHINARLYNVALTPDEIRVRAANALFGSREDVTRGFAEGWNAANAWGTVLPATVSSANNGTITNGEVISL